MQESEEAKKWYWNIRKDLVGKKVSLLEFKQAMRDHFWWAREAGNGKDEEYLVALRAGCDPELIKFTGSRYDLEEGISYLCMTYDGVEVEIPHKYSVLEKTQGKLEWCKERRTYFLEGDPSRGILNA